jgi:pSer/pThr/pTyr-binding forkhead associated (FHA) protein
MQNVIVGRNPDCDFRLLNGSVSRLHAVLKVSGVDKLVISDSGSRNGTYLWVNDNWKKVKSEEIKRSDRLRFGEAEADVLDILGSIKRRPKLGRGQRVKIGTKASGTGPTEKQLARFKKPRRNKITGDIEEGG